MASPCYCVVCAVRLQFKILWQGYIKKNKKNLRFHWRVYRRTITRRYFTELKNIYGIVPLSPTDSPTDKNPLVFHRELQKNYGIVPLSPTDVPTDKNPSVFQRELQNNNGIVPQSPTDLPTEYNPSVFHRELQKNYGIVPHSPTGLPTELPTESPTAHACLTRVRLHYYLRHFRCKIPTASPAAHACLTRVRLHDFRRIEKFGGIFEPFWCAFQLISDGI